MTYCPTNPISSGVPRFLLKILNPDQHAIGIGKIRIFTSVLIFLYNGRNSYDRVYFTLIS